MPLSARLGRGGAAKILYACLFASGAAGLIAEVVWARQFGLIFGSSAWAVAVVLASFMAGMSAGSALLGRIADRTADLLLMYAAMEAGIGACVAATPWLFPAIESLYARAAGAFGMEGWPLRAVQAAGAFAATVVPTALMGGTLPTLVRFLARTEIGVGGGIGRLYAANTLGAASGAYATAFLLIESLGMRGTLLAACALNLLAAAGAIVLRRCVAVAEAAGSRGPLGRRWAAVDDGIARCEGAAGGTSGGVRAGVGRAEDGEAPHDGTGAGEGGYGGAAADRGVTGQPPASYGSILLIAAFASGFISFGFEIVWTRLLSTLCLGSTSYAFASMLTVFLLGIVLGSAVFGAFFRDAGRARSVTVFAVCQIALFLSGAAAPRISLAVSQVGDVAWTSGGDAASSGPVPDAVVASSFLIRSAAVMFIPTFLMGITFPLLARLYSDRPGREAGSLGLFYAANSAGAIIGSIAGTFLLLERSGAAGSSAALSTAGLAVGLLVWAIFAGERGGKGG
ncbi:MAG: hypothetical protein N3A38_06285, partial [Planctomycetota bacterium]|nr:hypothetical protein [Planctomycetota bacterium]